MYLHRLSLALIGLFVGALTVGLIPLAATAPASADEAVALTCFPHAPAELRYSDTWGAARSGGRGHKGTDLMSPKGTHVLAVADGVVTGLKDGSSSGLYVQLAHEGGWETYYMHLNNDTPGTDDGRGGAATAYAPGLSVGDTVTAGQHIGYVGDSGNAEGSSSHTHFELHLGGSAVNPYSYLFAVEAHQNDLTERILAAASLSGDPLASVRAPLWDEVTAGNASDCLPEAATAALTHIFGEVPAPPPSAEQLTPISADRPSRGGAALD